jgi:hypothetical protein
MSCRRLIAGLRAKSPQQAGQLPHQRRFFETLTVALHERTCRLTPAGALGISIFVTP